ncbi:MAG: hypothetical protein MJA83_02000, partial [Gammaproteobacteria bacterium]|nr:hypothetical protein [Gammaproteobacteria bacterium]
MTQFLYLLRRETWEHPAFYVAPAVVGIILLLLTVTGFVQGIGEHIGYDLLVEEWGDRPHEIISRSLGLLMASI